MLKKNMKASFCELTLRTAIKFKFNLRIVLIDIEYKLDESQIDWIINKPKSLNKTTFNIEQIFL